MKDSYPYFSVCISVYKNDKPEYVSTALDSILLNQTVRPSEVVLVADGPIPTELDALIQDYSVLYSDMFNYIRLESNQGLGNALRIAVVAAKYDLIARMDSDDISLPHRFENQLDYFDRHPECDIVGGQISEFVDSPENIVAKRIVPLTNPEIQNYMKSRCGMNHVTVMFRKKAVLDAGNYMDWFWNEDYYLWVRMMKNHCFFSNVPDILVNVRVGNEMYKRRGGKRYFASEKGIQMYLLNHHMISRARYAFNVLIRFFVQVAMPNWLRGFVFRVFFR